MKHLILGTAGHIDHGKTALVAALTGTDTDRLKEEKERGITIELGFAELELPEVHFGVVDVPGHEAFVRAMVAGAAGMDVVLMVVAADEGVMPQTREHLAIIELLDVPELVVAITKLDTVDAEWLELVQADIADLLEGTRYEGARAVPNSAASGEGLAELKDVLGEVATRVETSASADLVRIPLDRVFTIQGTGTVVTGTVWTGSLAKGDRVRILPADLQARVRGLQVHGKEVQDARAGDRAAVALTGDGSDRDVVARGATMVSSPAWDATWMLTVHVGLLPDTTWNLEHNQRVRVHVGTAEVMARVALLESDSIIAGGRGWVQLRLEEPVVARARDRVVLRAYSPVTTFGGGVVAEPLPPKRNRLTDVEREHLFRMAGGDAADCIGSLLEMSGWHGIRRDLLPVLTGLPPEVAAAVLGQMSEGELLASTRRLFAATILKAGRTRILEAVSSAHAADPIKPAIPLALARASVPKWANEEVADALIDRLCDEGTLKRVEGGVRDPEHNAELSADQSAAVTQLEAFFSAEGLTAPLVDEYPDELLARSDLWSLLKHMEADGRVSPVADGYYVSAQVLSDAIFRIQASLSGRNGLGPADFREVLDVSRRHLIPLLNHFDGLGVTLRGEDGREVP